LDILSVKKEVSEVSEGLRGYGRVRLIRSLSAVCVGSLCPC